jgi:hypothetical protein
MAVTVKNTVFWDVMLFSMDITNVSDKTAASIFKPMLEGSHNRSL